VNRQFRWERFAVSVSTRHRAATVRLNVVMLRLFLILEGRRLVHGFRKSTLALRTLSRSTRERFGGHDDYRRVANETRDVGPGAYEAR